MAALDPVRLRITTISLLNSEKLTLNWSSNAKIKNAVSYELTFYKADDKTKLFSLMMSPNDMGTKGWDGKSGSTSEMASFTLLDKDGNEKGIWDFPVSQSPNGYSLVLDAMMSAEMLARWMRKAEAVSKRPRAPVSYVWRMWRQSLDKIKIFMPRSRQQPTREVIRG